jgi:serine/threonine protein kinase
MDPAPRSEQEKPDQVHVTEKADSVAGEDHDTGFVAGSMVGGRYKILSEIGRGGMGVVFKVEQVFFREIYAFKLLQEQHLQGKPFARFQTEAQATNRLNHRNLVSCKDFGLLEDNRPFLVMEFIQGVTLEETLKNRGALPIKEALEIFLQVCDGMAYAHDHGIIHRDLKPSNIMLPDKTFDTKYDVVKILDFGIAKIVCDEDRQAVTRTGEIFGSPYYMSPEQCLGKNIDLRSDIYALGCVFFEALTGLPPYSAETALATMMQHQSNTIPTLKQASLGGDFPQALEQVVARLLAKDPHHRYQSMMALKHDLQRVHDDQDIQWTGAEISKTPKRQNFTTKSACIGAAITALIALWLVTLTLMRPAPAPTSSAASKPADAVSDELALEKPIKYSDNSYYAPVPLKQAHGSWTLNFPDESIGTVALPPFKGNSHDGHRAQGTVTFSEPYPLSFIASSNACEKPKTFRRFRPDELWRVDVSNLMEASDDLLISLDHLTGLRGLILVSVDISDAGLEHLKNLPNLKDVRVSDSKITGAGLAKLKCIKHLDELWIDQIENVQPVLKALDGSTTISYLSAKHDRLTDADMTCISHLPNLEELRLAHDPINDAELAKLAGLKKLQELDLSHCKITSASIPTLLSFPRLSNLYLDISDWPDDKQRSFRQQFRGKLIKEKLPLFDDNPAAENSKQ